MVKYENKTETTVTFRSWKKKHNETCYDVDTKLHVLYISCKENVNVDNLKEECKVIRVGGTLMKPRENRETSFLGLRETRGERDQ